MKPNDTNRPETPRGDDKTNRTEGRSMVLYQESDRKTKNPSPKPAAKMPARTGNADAASNAGGKRNRNEAPDTKNPFS